MKTVSLKIALIYALAGVLWILFSDKLLAALVEDAAALTQLQTMKGGLYIAVTALLLFWLVHRDMDRLYKSKLEVENSRHELACTHQELIAAEEELRQQFDELIEIDQALRRSEERYRSLFDHMTDAFALHEILCDDRGNPVDYRFLAANPVFEQLTGLDKNTLTGKTVKEVLPQIESFWIERYGEVALTGKPASFTAYASAFGRHYSVNAYSPEKGQFAILFQDVTDRIHAEETLQQHNQYLSALHETSLALIKKLDLNDLLKAIVNRARSLAGTDHGFIFLVDETDSYLELRIGAGGYSKDIGFRLASGEGLSGKVWQSGQSMAVDDYSFWEGRPQSPRTAWPHAMVAVPLKLDSRVIGVLGLAHTDPARNFSQPQGVLLGGFAELASMALENARLYSSVQQELAERKRTEEKLRLVAKVFENTTDGVIITDSSGTIQLVNKAFCTITGYSAAEAVGQTPRILKSGLNDAKLYRNMWNSLDETGSWQGEVWNRRKNGEIYPERLTMCVITDDDGEITHYAALFSDLTEHKRDEQMIKYLNYHDVLTDLPNRSLFADRLAVAIAHAHHNQEILAVLFLNLDSFKTVNDALGHAAGDKLLKLAAERLKGCLREGDTIARSGGDEFMMLLVDIGQVEEAMRIAQAILEHCRQPWIIQDHELIHTASIGIAMYPADGSDAETIMKNADTALHRAKEAGRNNCQLYTPSMNNKVLEKLRLENSLHHALERNQFTLHYQPQVDIQTEQIVGFEALLRWCHPELGMIPPAKFIPLAEYNGLIIPIGEWVLHTACAQAMSWQKTGHPPVRVSVNLSARQFQQKDLIETVAKVLQRTGLPPSLLELEITESIAMQNVDFTAATLAQLNAMGIRIALDDFGTGYSSLVYLKRFPIDTLKIDRSFIADLDTEPEEAAIVTTIIVLAENLGLNVIAEGVETESQLAFLRQHNCHEMQGYYFSRPLPAEEIADKMATRR